MTRPSRSTIADWLRSPGSDVAVVTDPRQRRGIGIEIVIVLLLTFGLSALSSLLDLIESELRAGGIGGQRVALNQSVSTIGVIDALNQLLSAVHLFAIAGLAVYLLWRSDIALRSVGIRRLRPRTEIPAGLTLAALIGLPGLGLYVAARALHINAEVVPSDLTETWWRLPVLLLSAIANAAAEELLVVCWLITRLRQLGWGENKSLAASAFLRGGYHLYQGFGGGLGNVVMGLVYGRYFQRTSRIWPLVIGHATIDCVAFIGYALLKPHLGWLG